MRYAVLLGEFVDNVIECDEDKIALFVRALGLSYYVAVPADAPEARLIEPGGKVPDPAAAVDPDGDGLALSLSKLSAPVRAAAVARAEREAAERAAEAARLDYPERIAELVADEARAVEGEPAP